MIQPLNSPGFNAGKLAELILYVADRCKNDPAFGATKLNKILFFSDFLAFGKLGQSITGATYQRLDHGPAPRELLPVRNSLEESGSAQLLELPYKNKTQKRLFATREPNLDLFTAQEIAIVDQILEVCGDWNATELSELSHEISMGWRVAGFKEEIPYETVFLSSNEPTARDMERGRALADQYEWR